MEKQRWRVELEELECGQSADRTESASVLFESLTA